MATVVAGLLKLQPVLLTIDNGALPWDAMHYERDQHSDLSWYTQLS
jgi:hypothetical protein